MKPDQKVLEIIEARAGSSPEWAKAYAMLLIAESGQSVAAALRMLGTADAATPMGAIEFLAAEVKTGFERLASAIEEAADGG